MADETRFCRMGFVLGLLGALVGGGLVFAGSLANFSTNASRGSSSGLHAKPRGTDLATPVTAAARSVDPGSRSARTTAAALGPALALPPHASIPSATAPELMNIAMAPTTSGFARAGRSGAMILALFVKHPFLIVSISRPLAAAE